MKNKIIATLVAFGLVGSASAIEINDNLSINGFIDGSVNKVDGQTAGTDSSNWGLDEIEVNFLLNVGSVFNRFCKNELALEILSCIFKPGADCNSLCCSSRFLMGNIGDLPVVVL